MARLSHCSTREQLDPDAVFVHWANRTSGPFTGRRRRVGSEIVKLWYPVYGHPSGAHAAPWYRVDLALVYCMGPHPEGPSERPWYRITGDAVFTTEYHPYGGTDEPWFRQVGSLLYPASGHQHGPSSAPWYQVRRPSQ